MNYTKKVLALLLTLTMVLGGWPVTAAAADLSPADTPTATPGTTGQSTPGTTGPGAKTVTFDIPLNDSNETVFYLTEGTAVTDADLLLGVTAKDENNDPVTVTVQSTGGLNMQKPKMGSETYPNIPYIITYKAAHPESGEIFTETRELYVTAGAIMPLANDVAVWNSSTPPGISGWAGGNNTINVQAGAGGTLIVPDGVTTLTINGGGNTINGFIWIQNATLELILNNVTINSNTDSAILKNLDSGSLKLIINDTVKLNGAAGKAALNCQDSDSPLVIEGPGTLYATGGSGGNGINAQGGLTVDVGCTIFAAGGDGINGTNGGNGILVASAAGLQNNGTITATGGNGTNGFNGGNGIYALDSITNNSGGTITATGGNGGNSQSSRGGDGGDGVFSNNGTITNDLGNAAADFIAIGGWGGSGISGNSHGIKGDATNVAGTNIYTPPNVTFAAQNGIDLGNLTDLVIKADNITPLAGYTFIELRIGREQASKYTYDHSTGTLTILKEAFESRVNLPNTMPNMPPLKPGTYAARLIFKDTVNNIFLEYIVYFTVTGEYNNNNTGGIIFGSSGSSGKGRSTEVMESLWLERPEAQRLASKAKAQSEQNVRTIRKGTYGVRGNAWDRLAGLRYSHDTRIDGKLHVRLYIDEPSKMKKDTLVSAYTAGGWVETTKSKFEKYFTNNLQVIHFDQQADWEQSVEVAANLVLADMDTENLFFYAYDKKTNSYRLIGNPSYRIDKNGYLHFTTGFAGDIVISEGKLEKK